jgi:hypothetical protein
VSCAFCVVLTRDLSVVLAVRTFLRCHKVIHLRLHHTFTIKLCNDATVSPPPLAFPTPASVAHPIPRLPYLRLRRPRPRLPLRGIVPRRRRRRRPPRAHGCCCCIAVADSHIVEVSWEGAATPKWLLRLNAPKRLICPASTSASISARSFAFFAWTMMTESHCRFSLPFESRLK